MDEYEIIKNGKATPVAIVEEGSEYEIIEHRLASGKLGATPVAIVIGDTGGGGTGTLIVNTIADLDNVVDPIDGQLVAVAETNTFWKYTVGVWTDTEVLYSNFYGGQVSETTVDIIYQDYKSSSELIALFGVVSDSTITVDQSAVAYDSLGLHNVVFKFSKGRAITCRVNIVNRYTFDTDTAKKSTKTINNASNFVELYDKELDFSNYTLNLNGATAPAITGNRHEWSKRPPSDLRKIDIRFTNMTTLTDGRTVNCKMTFVEEELHPKDPQNQKWGFDIIDGNFVYLDGGYAFQKILLEFTDNINNVIYLNLATRVDNVHYAKHVGSDLGITEFFVSPNSLLKGETYYPENAELPIFIASRYEGDGDVLGSEDIALGIVRQDTSSIALVFGKDYTGDMDVDYSTLGYEEFPFTMRAGELNKVIPVSTISRSNTTPTSIAPGNFSILYTFPAGTFKDGANYALTASAKYTRSGGNSNPSNVGFRVVQGTTNYINDTVTVERDATTSLSMNIPQIVRRFPFNSTETVLIECFVPAGQVAVTIDEVRIRFTEVREVEL